MYIGERERNENIIKNRNRYIQYVIILYYIRLKDMYVHILFKMCIFVLRRKIKAINYIIKIYTTSHTIFLYTCQTCTILIELHNIM